MSRSGGPLARCVLARLPRGYAAEAPVALRLRPAWRSLGTAVAQYAMGSMLGAAGGALSRRGKLGRACLVSVPKHGGRGCLARRRKWGLVSVRFSAASEPRSCEGGSRRGSAGRRRRPADLPAAFARRLPEFAPGCFRSRAWHRGGAAQGNIQVKGLIGEIVRRRGTPRANTESVVLTAWGFPGIQITDRLARTRWADRGFPASRAEQGRRPDGGRCKPSLASAVSRGTHRCVQGTRS